MSDGGRVDWQLAWRLGERWDPPAGLLLALQVDSGLASLAAGLELCSGNTDACCHGSHSLIPTGELVRTTRARNVEKGRKTLGFSLKNKKPSYSAHLQTEEHGGVEVEGWSEGARLCRQKATAASVSGGQLAQVPCRFPEWAPDREAVWASSGVSWDSRK